MAIPKVNEQVNAPVTAAEDLSKEQVQFPPNTNPAAFSFEWKKVAPLAKAAFAFMAVSFIVGLVVKAIIILPAIVVGMICVGGYLLSAQKISAMVKNQAPKA